MLAISNLRLTSQLDTRHTERIFSPTAAAFSRITLKQEGFANVSGAIFKYKDKDKLPVACCTLQRMRKLGTVQVIDSKASA